MNVTGGIGISVPPMRYYCTYFDKNYLLKGLALISSLHAHEPDPFRLYVVCLDELTQELLNRLAIKQVVTVPLADIEAGDSGLASAKQNRSQVEYYWTLTPSVIACLLKRFPLIDVITYLDADLYFFSSTAPIYAALGDSSILIHEHRFSPQLAFLARYGTYNVGLLCFRNNADGLEALSWWRDRCLEWCYQRVEDGKFGDQLYLEDWPARFTGVRVLDHVGGGVAPWNHGNYRFSCDASGRPLVDGNPVIFYHFHAFTFLTPDVVMPARDLHYPLPVQVVTSCVAPYLNCLEQQLIKLRRIIPGFLHGLAQDAEHLKEQHSFVAHTAVAGTLQQGGGAPYPCVDLGNGWYLFCSSQTWDSSADASSLQPPLPEQRECPEKASLQICCKSPLPTLALVTPSYNQADYLEECIDSVLGQGYPNLEYVIMDGGSTDGSVDIIRKYERHLSYWQSRPDGGQYQAINEGFRHTRGELMTWLNSDDKFHPLAFAKAVSVFMTHPEAEWITGRQNEWDRAGRLHYLQENLEVLSRRKYLNGIFDKPFIQQEGTFWRRSLWETAGGTLSNSFELAGDLELWVRFFRVTVLHQVDTLLAGFRRVYGTQKSYLHREQYYHEAKTILTAERARFAGVLDALPAMPEPFKIDSEQVAALIAQPGFAPALSLDSRPAWRHYLDDIRVAVARLHNGQPLERVDFFQREVGLLTLIEKRHVVAELLQLNKLSVLRDQCQRFLQEGEDILGQGECRGAEQRFSRAAAIDPCSARLHRDLGRLNLCRGEYVRAFNEFRFALEYQPYNAGLAEEMIAVLCRLGLDAVAAAFCREFLTINPDCPEVRRLALGLAPHEAPKVVHPDNDSELPAVTAIISVYNAERFIHGRLEDLVGQTLFAQGRLELIIIDSDSPQKELAAIQPFLETYPDRIRYLRTDRRETVYAAWNRGVSMARGRYLINANTDDRFCNNALELLANALNADPALDAAYGDWLVTKLENDRLNYDTHQFHFRYPPFYPPLLLYYQISSHAVMLRRSVFEKIGMYRADLKVAGDREFMLRFASAGLKARRITATLGLYLEHAASVEHTEKSGRDELNMLRKQYTSPESLARLYGRPLPAQREELARLYVETGALGFQFYRRGGHWVSDLDFAEAMFVQALAYDSANTVAHQNLGIIKSIRHGDHTGARFWAGVAGNVLPPLVSVIVPTHNRPEMLREAVSSILHQSLSSLEVVVVNDGGDDLTELLDSMRDDRIVHLRLPERRERSAARNAGIRAARGQFIAYLDDDDLYYQDHLAIVIDFMQAQGVQAAYSDAYCACQQLLDGSYVTTERKVIYADEFDREKLLCENYIPILCMVHTRSCLETVGLFDESLRTHEDWDLWIRIARHYPVRRAPHITCEYRVRDDLTNTSTRYKADMVATQKEMYRRYRTDLRNPSESLLRQRGCLFNQLVGMYQTLEQQLASSDCPVGKIPADSFWGKLSEETTASRQQLLSAWWWYKAHRCADRTERLDCLEKAIEADEENAAAALERAQLLCRSASDHYACETALRALLGLNPLDSGAAEMLLELQSRNIWCQPAITP